MPEPLSHDAKAGRPLPGSVDAMVDFMLAVQ